MSEKKSKKKDKKEDKSNEKDELISLLKKVQADFENYQKRTEKEQKEFTAFACQDVIRELLPVLDSFDLALNNEDNEDIKAIYGQLTKILATKGLEKIKAQGEKFDPFLHEALLQEPGEEDGIVLEELQAGYKLKDVVIRHTKVKVSKK